MSQFDLIIRAGQIVTHQGERLADIGVGDGKIAALQSSLPGGAREEINAADLHIFPGLIDAHVHFNEPGRTSWEGIESGSRAFAAGGGTLFFDMPLNAHPPTLDAAGFDLKFAAAQKNSLTDFAFWGGLVPGNAGNLDELAARGVIGFKAFMSDSGIDDFPRADETTLRQGMKRAAQLQLPVAVHAESDALTKTLTAQKIAAGKITVRDYLDSRPIAAELEAIGRAIDLAGETGCALHVVHVSSGAGLALIAAAKKAGANVSCETCPHYLVLTEDDMENLGAVAKCAPPLRSQFERTRLWQHILAGEVTTIGSDHSPSPPEMKTDTNFFKVWGGISGAQHTLPLLLTEGPVHPGVALSLIAKLTSFNVARRFRLPETKGSLQIGADADLALVDLREKFSVRPEDLFYRHPQSPYVGRVLTGRVVQTILRGQTIFQHGKIVGAIQGQLIKPV
jgi:allantoinase